MVDRISIQQPGTDDRLNDMLNNIFFDLALLDLGSMLGTDNYGMHSNRFISGIFYGYLRFSVRSQIRKFPFLRTRESLSVNRWASKIGVGI